MHVLGEAGIRRKSELRDVSGWTDFPTASFLMLTPTCRQEETGKPAAPIPNLIGSVHVSRNFIALKTFAGERCNYSEAEPCWYATRLGTPHRSFTFIPPNFSDLTRVITDESYQWTETGSSRGQFSPQPLSAGNNHLVIYRGAEVKHAPSSSTSVKCLKLDGTNPHIRVFQRPLWPLEIIINFNRLWVRI